MSFKQLYEPCFKNIPLVNVSQQLQSNGSNHEKCLTTIGHVFKSSSFVIFFIAQPSSSSFHETLQALQKFMKTRRGKTLIPNNSPARFKRLFGIKKSKKPVNSEETSECSIVIVDVDQNQVDMQIDKGIDFDLFVMPQSSITYLIKCPPCRSLNKQLQVAYEKIRSQGHPFEIIYCSLDRSEASFEEHFTTMPWLSFPFNSNYLQELARIYDVNGIPTVILLDEENNLISRHGRSVLLSDPTGKNFPWKNPSIYELNEFTVNRIGDFPSVILFTEGTPEDTEFSLQLLKPFLGIYGASSTVPLNDKADDNISKKSENMPSLSNSESSLTESDPVVPAHADQFQFFYTGEDPFCDYILESLGLAQAELPLIVICDVISGHMAICDKPDVSETVVSEFIQDYRNGRAKVVPLPYSQTSETRKVGGIPVNVIEHLICNQQAGSVASK